MSRTAFAAADEAVELGRGEHLDHLADRGGDASRKPW